MLIYIVRQSDCDGFAGSSTTAHGEIILHEMTGAEVIAAKKKKNLTTATSQAYGVNLLSKLNC